MARHPVKPPPTKFGTGGAAQTKPGSATRALPPPPAKLPGNAMQAKAGPTTAAHAPPSTKFGSAGAAQTKTARGTPMHAPPPTKFGNGGVQRHAAVPAQRVVHAPPPTRFSAKTAQPMAASAKGPGRPLPAGSAVIQPMMIDENSSKKPVPPTGKFAKELSSQLAITLLNSQISNYGIKKNFFEPMIKDDLHFKTSQEAVEYMAGEIKKEMALEDIKKQKNKKYKRKIHAFKLSRPGWPKNYRSLLNAISGDDIRHIVRNATLKRAIEAEVHHAKQFGEPAATKYFSEMAGELGLTNPSIHHYLEYSKAIYNHLYLNIGNLFAGPGGVNQSIGFAADPIAKMAEGFENNSDQRVSIDDVYDEIYGAFQKTFNNIESKAKKLSTNFVQGYQEYKTNIKAFLEQLYFYWADEYGYCEDDETVTYVDAGDIADDIYDISDNLGFDLITITDSVDAAQRHAILVTVESKLKSGSYTKGNHELTAIFKDFMSAAQWV